MVPLLTESHKGWQWDVEGDAGVAGAGYEDSGMV